MQGTHSYVLEHRVSHADVDLLGEIKVTALLGLLEQAAVEASWDCGFDPAWYAEHGRVWIIRRTRLERRLPVGGGDVLRVATHVLDWRRARSLRAYEVRRAARDGRAHDVGDEPPAAVATTDWVYCDVASGRPASIPEEMRRRFSGDGPVTTLPRARALPDAAAGEAVAMTVTVRPSLLDHVTHVNNAAYAALLEDGAFELFAAQGITVERMLALGGALRMRALDLEYLDDAVAGDRLVVRSWPLTDGEAARVEPRQPREGARPRDTSLLQTIDRDGDGLILRARSEWTWRERPTVLGGVPRP
ncbi:MAG: acyl-CoA thioesterase [Thermodesulfobacteriota bacterium]